MAGYRLVTEWETEAPITQVWDTIIRYDAWPTWWRGVRAVTMLGGGDDSGLGSVLRQEWRALLPFPLIFDLEMVRIAGPRLLEGRASGDLVGTCAWSLDQRGGRSSIQFSIDVRPGRWWMNLPVPFAGWVFRRNFDAVMRWGRRGLARTLGTPVRDRSDLIMAAAT